MTDTSAPAPTEGKPVLGRFTDLVKTQGFKGAAKAGWGDVKNIVGKSGEVTMGQRGVGFARVAGVGICLSIAKGAFESKTADGEERGALGRLGQAVLGTGVAVGSMVVGGAR